MSHINIEFKAQCNNPKEIRAKLVEAGAYHHGRDHQVDVYFNVPEGRLKLRKGNIENNLIAYDRTDHAGTKQSNVELLKTRSGTHLENALAMAWGVVATVDKQRDIYFIGNVKFHIDNVAGLGSFMEVEAIDSDGAIGQKRLQEQCAYYKQFLGIRDSDMIAVSYSDLLLQK